MVRFASQVDLMAAQVVLEALVRQVDQMTQLVVQAARALHEGQMTMTAVQVPRVTRAILLSVPSAVEALARQVDQMALLMVQAAQALHEGLMTKMSAHLAQVTRANLVAVPPATQTCRLRMAPQVALVVQVALEVLAHKVGQMTSLVVQEAGALHESQMTMTAAQVQKVTRAVPRSGRVALQVALEALEHQADKVARLMVQAAPALQHRIANQAQISELRMVV